MGNKKVQMSPWEKLPGHSWNTVHKVRQDSSGDVIEEVTGERGAVVGFVFGWIIVGTGWWWQSNLDGWPRTLVIVLTVVVSLYMLVITGWIVVMHLVSRFVRNV